MSRFERPAGFTLIELLIVLAIMAAASVWFASYLRVGIASAELRTATRELRAALDETRSLAIRSDRVMAVSVDLRGHLYRDPMGLHRVPQDLALAVSGDAGAIYFFPDGSSSGGEIAFAASGASEIVSVDWFTGQAVAHAPRTEPR